MISLSDLLLFLIAQILLLRTVLKIILPLRDKVWLRGFLDINPVDWARASTRQDRTALSVRAFEHALTLYRYKVLAFLRAYCEEHRAKPISQGGIQSADELLALLKDGSTRVVSFRHIASIPLGHLKRIEDVRDFVVAVANEKDIVDVSLPDGLPEELQQGLANLVRASYILFKS